MLAPCVRAMINHFRVGTYCVEQSYSPSFWVVLRHSRYHPGSATANSIDLYNSYCIYQDHKNLNLYNYIIELYMFSVIGYSNDTRTQAINEGESSTLTVEIKKPAVGMGSPLDIDFQIDSANSGK